MRVQALQEEHSVAELCQALGVSRSGYHGWVAREPGPRAQANATLWPLIEQAYAQSRQTYGSPRVWQWLKGQGKKCGRHRVARLMRQHRVQSQTRRRWRWRSRIGSLRRVWCIIRIAGCNTPVPPTASAWRRQKCSRA